MKHLLGIFNNTVGKVRLAGLYTAEFHGLEGAIVKINMTEYHFIKPGMQTKFLV